MWVAMVNVADGTLDKGFADLRQHPPGTHAGVILLRARKRAAVLAWSTPQLRLPDQARRRGGAPWWPLLIAARASVGLQLPERSGAISRTAAFAKEAH
jgi:hypothetical protein